MLLPTFSEKMGPYLRVNNRWDDPNLLRKNPRNWAQFYRQVALLVAKHAAPKESKYLADRLVVTAKLYEGFFIEEKTKMVLYRRKTAKQQTAYKKMVERLVEAKAIEPKEGELLIKKGAPPAPELTVFNPQTGRRGPRYRAGGFLRPYSSGRKFIRPLLPHRETGVPTALEQDVLVSFLAAAFATATGCEVTYGFDMGVPYYEPSYSEFERFCHPIFEALEIKGSRSLRVEHIVRKRIRKHVESRPD